ncbi:MAG: hypothetical protein PVS3B1_38950 [Ktedonobacteraceae bacterium]
MSQSSSDKYVYFTVGILKDTQTLDALRQDALKHHMVDHPGQLIALRLAEYYEMMHNVTVQPVMHVPQSGDSSSANEKARLIEDTSPHPSHPSRPAQPMHPVHLAPGAPSPAAKRSYTPLPAVPSTPVAPVLPAAQGQAALQGQPSGGSGSGNSFLSQNTGRLRALRPESESIIAASPNADQNADEAADYWRAL